MKTKFILLLLTLTSLVINTQSTQAQTYTPSNRLPVADNTLIGTQVSATGTNFDITGGLRKGQTLFHSFTDFSIPTDRAANFLNPVGNRDIITRVTGGLFSDINGVLNSNGANFFLINPNGIVFGTNAQLNVGRAFMASTANGIDFVGGGGAITFGTNPNGDAPLLSVAPDVLFNPSQLNLGGGNGGISNFGTLQTSNPSQYIGLIGGDISLDGGKIVAPGGRVDIGGLNSAGTVTANEQGLVFSGNSLIRGDVSLTNGAAVSVRANDTLGNVNIFGSDVNSLGSSINIGANNINIINNNSTIQPNLDAGLNEKVIATNNPAGDINLNANGRITLDNAGIYQTLFAGAQGKAGDIKFDTNHLEISRSFVSNSTLGKGDAGKIIINATGDINLSNQGRIFSSIGATAEGNSSGIEVKNAGNLTLRDRSLISTLNGGGIGKTGNIDIKTNGDLNIIGTGNIFDPPSGILSGNTSGKGDAGKITIDSTADIKLNNNGKIFSVIGPTAEGNSPGIEIKNARNLTLSNQSVITASNLGGFGKAGDIDIKTTGNISIVGTEKPSTLYQANSEANLYVFSSITANTAGKGDTGKITLDATGDIILSNRGQIESQIGSTAAGNSQGIEIKNARNLTVDNESSIQSNNFGIGNAGNIKIQTTGNININGTNTSSLLFANNPSLINLGARSTISSSTNGKGDTGKIIINAKGDINITNTGNINSIIGGQGQGNSQGIEIKTGGNLNLRESSNIGSDNNGGVGNSGDINIESSGKIELSTSVPYTVNNSPVYSSISSNTFGEGKAGNIKIAGQQLILRNSNIFTLGYLTSGGDINLGIRDLLLLRNDSTIATDSYSQQQNSSGGNIKIDTPLIVATPGDNDINANAYEGTGGRVNITSQGLFGIQYRPKGQESLLTNDITSSSAFGQDGTVNIDTPGTDPGRDTTELPNTTIDASNQISQICSAENRRNKLTVTGRGGLPENAYEPLNSPVVWQDARAVSSQPAVNPTTNNPAQLPPPAVGWVFDGKGKVTLIAAGEGQPTRMQVVCPNK